MKKHSWVFVPLAFFLIAGLIYVSPSQRAKRASTEGKRLYDGGDLKGAVALFGSAVELQPNAPDHHYRLGAALYKARLYEQARTEFQETLRLDPKDIDARRALAAVTNRIATNQAALVADELSSR